jgi:hypothetical protein
MRFLLLLCVLLATPVLTASAQNPARADSVDTVTELQLRDGTVYIGHIIEESDTEVVLRTSSGTVVRVAKSQIVSRKRIQGRVSGDGFRRFDPNNSRLFFAPTGRTLDQGTAYLSAYYVFFGFVGYGVTDRFTLAGGTLLIPEAFGDLLYLAPKFQVMQKGNNSVSVGVLAGLLDGTGAGIGYASFTKGQPDQSFTLGVGFAYGDGDVFSKDPLIVIGGEKQLGRRTKLVGEAYALPTVTDAAFVYLGGIRFYNSNLAADIGLIGAVGEDGGGALPWVSFAYLFGR